MFDEVNQLSRDGISDFRIESLNGGQLRIVGSFDLCYYHDIEIEFADVAFIRCPTLFFYPQFLQGFANANGIAFEIRTDDDAFEIVAAAVSVKIGKVYYFDPGTNLKAGERIASWVNRQEMHL